MNSVSPYVLYGYPFLTLYTSAFAYDAVSNNTERNDNPSVDFARYTLSNCGTFTMDAPKTMPYPSPR